MNKVKEKYGEKGFDYEAESIKEILMNPRFLCERGDKKNLSRPDYLITDTKNKKTIFLDPKLKNEPYYKLKEKIGLDPSNAFVIDTDKIRAYINTYKKEKIPVYLLVKIDYDGNKYGVRCFHKGEYVISIQTIMKLGKKYGYSRIREEKDHEKGKYKKRFYIKVDEVDYTYEEFLNKMYGIKRSA